MRTLRLTCTALAVALVLGVAACSARAAHVLPSGVPSIATIAHLARAHGDPVTAGEADGRIAGEGLTVADTDEPAIANLDPHLRTALALATHAAAEQGITLQITSGWRSKAYQQQLLDQAVTRYGSLAEAEKWVATPAASSHTHGEAVDVGPARAAGWLHRYGAAYGLCQTYANEPWHFQLETAPGSPCPVPKTDAAE